jgi:hypothetical protein
MPRVTFVFGADVGLQAQSTESTSPWATTSFLIQPRSLSRSRSRALSPSPSPSLPSSFSRCSLSMLCPCAERQRCATACCASQPTFLQDCCCRTRTNHLPPPTSPSFPPSAAPISRPAAARPVLLCSCWREASPPRRASHPFSCVHAGAKRGRREPATQSESLRAFASPPHSSSSVALGSR